MSDAWLLIGLPLVLAALPVTGVLARRKGRGVGPWLLLSVICWPLSLTLLALLAVAEVREARVAGDIRRTEDALITVGAVSWLLLAAAGVYAALL